MSLINKLIVLVLPLIPKLIVRFFSKPYIAGPHLDDAIRVVKDLNQKGMLATMDVLGESATNPRDSLEAVEEYYKVLEKIDSEKLQCNISIKPTQLGLLIDKNACYTNIRNIIQKAAEYNNFVRIDMEDSNVTQDTIDLFLKLQEEFNNVGIVIQAYMRRSLEDIKNLVKTGTNFRICKGIYIEPRNIAYKNPRIVNNNFSLLINKALSSNCYVGIATHDEFVVWESFKHIEDLNLKKENYEFQMLLGVDEYLRQILVSEGHRLRVYVPFGKHWYAYSVRRLKENPKMASYILKALFKSKHK